MGASCNCLLSQQMQFSSIKGMQHQQLLTCSSSSSRCIEQQLSQRCTVAWQIQCPLTMYARTWCTTYWNLDVQSGSYGTPFLEFLLSYLGESLMHESWRLWRCTGTAGLHVAGKVIPMSFPEWWTALGTSILTAGS